MDQLNYKSGKSSLRTMNWLYNLRPNPNLDLVAPKEMVKSEHLKKKDLEIGYCRNRNNLKHKLYTKARHCLSEFQVTGLKAAIYTFQWGLSISISCPSSCWREKSILSKQKCLVGYSLEISNNKNHIDHLSWTIPAWKAKYY